MRSAILSFTVLTAFAVTPALAQTQQPEYGAPPSGGPMMGEVHAPPSHQPMSHHATNLNAQTTRSEISPSLPVPPVGPNADASAYLEAAQNALSRNRTGEAQAALENAETYLLNRSVPMNAVNEPDRNPAVRNINAALQSLANRDRAQTMSLIQETIPLARRYEARVMQRSNNMQAENPAGMYGNGAYQPPPPGTSGYQGAPNDYRTGMNSGAYQPGPGTAGYQSGSPPPVSGYQGSVPPANPPQR